MNFKSIIKSIIKVFFGILFIALLVSLVGYVLYTAPLTVGIIFSIVLALISGYFGFKIKDKMDRKEMETNIDTKIQNQKYPVTMKEMEDAEKVLSEPSNKALDVPKTPKITKKSPKSHPNKKKEIKGKNA